MNKKHKIFNNLDYIIYPKYKNSLTELLKHNPNGVSDKIICEALDMELKELKKIYSEALSKLKRLLDDAEK